MALYQQRNPAMCEAMQLTAETADEMVAWCGGALNTKATDPAQPVVTLRPPGRGTTTVNAGEYLAKHPGGWAVYLPGEFEAGWELRSAAVSDRG